MIAPGRWPAACSSKSRTSSTVASPGAASSGGVGRLRDPRPAVERDDARGRRRLRRRDRRRDEHELLDVAEPERRVRLALAADRRRPVAAHVAAAERPRHVTGVDLDSRRQLGEPRQRGVEVLGALARGDREIGTGGVADEQRVARQHDALVDHEGAVLGPVPGRVQHADRHRADARGRRRPRAAPTRTRARRADAPRRAAPCSSASLPWPETWSACVCVSSTRSMRTPSCAAAASSSSIANGGSTTTATPASGSPTRYDAQPRSSFTNCRKSSTDRDVNTGRGGRSARCRPDPAVDPGEQRDEREQRRDDCDHKRCVRRASARSSPSCWSRRR